MAAITGDLNGRCRRKRSTTTTMAGSARVKCTLHQEAAPDFTGAFPQARELRFASPSGWALRSLTEHRDTGSRERGIPLAAPAFYPKRAGLSRASSVSPQPVSAGVYPGQTRKRGVTCRTDWPALALAAGTSITADRMGFTFRCTHRIAGVHHQTATTRHEYDFSCRGAGRGEPFAGQATSWYQELSGRVRSGDVVWASRSRATPYVCRRLADTGFFTQVRISYPSFGRGPPPHRLTRPRCPTITTCRPPTSGVDLAEPTGWRPEGLALWAATAGQRTLTHTVADYTNVGLRIAKLVRRRGVTPTRMGPPETGIRPWRGITRLGVDFPAIRIRSCTYFRRKDSDTGGYSCTAPFEHRSTPSARRQKASVRAHGLHKASWARSD